MNYPQLGLSPTGHYTLAVLHDKTMEGDEEQLLIKNARFHDLLGFKCRILMNCKMRHLKLAIMAEMLNDKIPPSFQCTSYC